VQVELSQFALRIFIWVTCDTAYAHTLIQMGRHTKQCAVAAQQTRRS
jgi:hypothetical protein